jgi:hypothetical protein
MGSIHKTKSLPRRGYRTQPTGFQPWDAQGANPGTEHPERCALKGRQIERPNQAEAGSDGQL